MVIRRLFQLALIGAMGFLAACEEGPATDPRAIQRGIMAFQAVCMDRAPNYDNQSTQNLFARKWGYSQPWIEIDRATGQPRNLDPNVRRAADGGLAGQGLLGAQGSGELGCLVYVPARNTQGVADAISSLAAARMPIDPNPVTALSNKLNAGGDIYVLAKDRRGGDHVIVVSYKPDFFGNKLGQTLIMIAPRRAIAGAF